MGRHKTFSVYKALDTVTALFRRRGYHDISMQIIADHLGLSRTSIYATYGDKHTLFALLRVHAAGRCGVTVPEPPAGASPTLRCPDCDPVTPANPLRFGTRLALCSAHAPSPNRPPAPRNPLRVLDPPGASQDQPHARDSAS